jgi:hypothetical protein
VSKFFSGALVALSAMISLEVPCVNVLSKMDLLNAANKELIESFLEPNALSLCAESTSAADDERQPQWARRHAQLSRAIATVV